MNAEQGTLLTQKADVIDGLVSHKVATPLRTSRIRNASPVASLIQMGENGYTHQFLLVSKGSLVDNAVVWVAPEYGKITGDGGVLDRVICTLTEKTPIVIPEDLPFEGIPGYIIGDEQVAFGFDRIKPVAERESTDVYLSSALALAIETHGDLSVEESRLVNELIRNFPVP